MKSGLLLSLVLFFCLIFCGLRGVFRLSFVVQLVPCRRVHVFTSWVRSGHILNFLDVFFYDRKNS